MAKGRQIIGEAIAAYDASSTLSLTVQRAVHGLGWVRSASDSGLSSCTWALMKRLLAMQEAAAYRYYCYPDKGPCYSQHPPPSTLTSLTLPPKQYSKPHSINYTAMN
jgi:hypothetical protein